MDGDRVGDGGESMVKRARSYIPGQQEAGARHRESQRAEESESERETGGQQLAPTSRPVAPSGQANFQAAGDLEGLGGDRGLRAFRRAEAAGKSNKRPISRPQACAPPGLAPAKRRLGAPEGSLASNAVT